MDFAIVDKPFSPIDSVSRTRAQFFADVLVLGFGLLREDDNGDHTG